MNCLYLDLDRSTASIGGYRGVEATLGFAPVPVTNGLAEVSTILRSLVTRVQTESESPFLDGVVETRIVLNDRARDLGVEGLVIDTASTLADQEYKVQLAAYNGRRAQRGLEPLTSLDKSTWGPYGQDLKALYQGLAMTDVVGVVTCHEKRSADEATGFALYEPNIMGSSSTSMLRFFDAVFYAKVKGVGDEAEFVWQTRPDQTRPHAKVRGVDLPHEVPQDFGPVIEAFREAGTRYPLLLVIGESGSGKTTSLATLGPVAPLGPIP